MGSRLRWRVDEGYRQRLARLRELRASYMASHRVGMSGLERGDLDALDAAIQSESEIIQEQAQILAELRNWRNGCEGEP
jgi:hypothetical protein